MKKDPTEWRKKVAAWKNGTPTSELFNLPKYDDGTDEEDPPSVKLSREIMSILRGGDFASSRIESGEPGESDALATYLLSRKQLRELFLKHGYIESPKDYGLVKKAVGKRDLPVYQRSEDQIDRLSVIPIGNVDTLWGGDKDDMLVHAGNYPTTIYLDPKTLDLYQKAWDLNDYGPSSGGTATHYGFPKQVAANLLDLIGSPVVVTTGIRKIKYPKQDEFLNLKDNYMKSKGYHIMEDYEDVPLYDMSGKNVIGKFSEKTKRYTLPEITVTAPKKHNSGKSIKPLPKYDMGNPPQKLPKSNRALGNLFYRTLSFLPQTRAITNAFDILKISPDDSVWDVGDVGDVAGTTEQLLQRTKKTPVNNGTIAKLFAEGYNKRLGKVLKPFKFLDIAGDVYQWILDAKAYGDALREEMPNGIYNSGITIDPNDYHDKGKSIHIKPANRGKFNATKKRTGKTTEQLAHSKNPLTRKRAVFALNARRWKH